MVALEGFRELPILPRFSSLPPLTGPGLPAEMICCECFAARRMENWNRAFPDLAPEATSQLATFSRLVTITSGVAPPRDLLLLLRLPSRYVGIGAVRARRKLNVGGRLEDLAYGFQRVNCSVAKPHLVRPDASLAGHYLA